MVDGIKCSPQIQKDKNYNLTSTIDLSIIIVLIKEESLPYLSIIIGPDFFFLIPTAKQIRLG